MRYCVILVGVSVIMIMIERVWIFLEFKLMLFFCGLL